MSYMYKKKKQTARILAAFMSFEMSTMFLNTFSFSHLLYLKIHLRKNKNIQKNNRNYHKFFSSDNWMHFRHHQNNTCTIMSVMFSVCLISLLFCYDVIEGRPQQQQQQQQQSNVNNQFNRHVGYFMDDFSLSNNIHRVNEHQKQQDDEQIRPTRHRHYLAAAAGEFDEFADVDEDEEDDDETVKPIDVVKLRQTILGELGLTETWKNSSFSIPKANISRDEYVRAYTEYMANIQKRRSEENELLTSSHKERRKYYRRTVQFFDDLLKESHQTTFVSHNQTVRRQLMFDINFSEFYKTDEVRIKKATLSLPTGCSLEGSHDKLKQLDITTNVTYWINQNEGHQHRRPIILTAECLSSSQVPADGSAGQVKVILKLRPKETLDTINSKRRVRRSFVASGGTIRDYLNRGKGRDCDKTRHGKTCCRRPLKVDLNDLNVKDLILEPATFDAYMCSGRCNARRVPFASTHAMIQQALHRKFGKKVVPRPCCTPTELQSLDVIHAVPGENRLEVTVLRDAVVVQCGCS